MSEPESRFTRPNSIDKANFVSRFFFVTATVPFPESYLIPLFVKGVRNNGIDLSDLPRCPAEDEAELGLWELSQNWLKDKCAKKPSFAWTVFRTYAKHFVLPLTGYIVQEFIFQLGGPLLLSRVIRFFSNDPKVSYIDACISAAGVCLCNFVLNLIYQPIHMSFLKLGIKMRTACVSLMYKKCLKLSQSALGQTEVGQIVNLMSNDVSRFEEFSTYVRSLVVAPFHSTLVIYIVWTYLGDSAFVGIAVLFLYIPVQGMLFGRMFANVRFGIATRTDTRLRYMNEIISGIHCIKMYCWERPFAERVAEARKAEIDQVRKSCYLRSINIAMSQVGNRLFLFVCFVAYVLWNDTLLSAEAVFVSMQLFYILSSNMTWAFPCSISVTSEVLITCSRIQQFLLLDEINSHNPNKFCTIRKYIKNSSIKSTRSSKTTIPFVRLSGITAKWNQASAEPTLKNISVDLKPGHLLAVIGPVGSGKSSFLMSLLKELPIASGMIHLNGSIAYAAQDAWSFAESARNNILFGAEFDEERYRKVVDVCAMSRDFTLMSNGDQTLVGEKGVLLSGGQKSRLNLARAVYRDADIYLMDAPLAAVDAPVARYIFEKCILGYLGKKIRILVTHQIQFIEKATKVLILNEGKCLAYGTYKQIQEMGLDFMKLLDQDPDQEEIVQKDRTVSQKSEYENHELAKGKPLKIAEESYQRGAIKWKIYSKYITSGAGPCMILFMITMALLSQSLFNGSDIFLSYWTNESQNSEPSTTNARDISIYSAMIGALFLVNIIRAVTFFTSCMKSSERLHNQTFARMLRAPTAFFDSVPTGQILNVFAKDAGNIDERLPFIWFDFTLHGGQALGVLVTVCIMRWVLVVPAIILLILVICLRQVYLKSATYLQRYEGITRSPVFSHVSTTINGLASIRAYGAQSAFAKQFFMYQNDHLSTLLTFSRAAKALAMAMSLLCSFFVCTITAVVMIAKDTASGTAGLIISSGLAMTTATQWGIRMSAEFENQMASVERLVEYQRLEQEARPKPGSMKPDKEWPSIGQIEFKDMSLTYENNQEKPVLKNINVTIHGGEKIGIVGRTGAGKSSLISALFRLTEPKGTILIDGVNILTIGLDTLRKKVSIIPQEPVVFSGTVRYNLDPFSEYSDSVLWSALEKVQLKSQIDVLEGKLEAKLTEKGANLSVGQRQLICLARAILRQNRIIILDEATANVDHQTDALIQQTIREEFASCTVLTIAHRLNSIVDTDRVLVLDAGEVVEFDAPYKLLKDRGIFHEMCQQTGSWMYLYLYNAAKDAYRKKQTD